MANSVCEVLITTQPLAGRTGTAIAADADGEAGAIVDFWGVVRRLEEAKEIDGIDYEAHIAMAKHQLQLVVESAAAKFQLKQVIAHHRIGFVAAGETSLFLRVKAPHRAPAFAASKWMVDELKKKVPIWKRPRFKIDPPSLPLRRARQPRTSMVS
jgi:molybdopterin synthase catalytic subunit